jgi:hypothetical protein
MNGLMPSSALIRVLLLPTAIFVIAPLTQAQTVQFSVNAAVHHPISPFIYGTNDPDWAGTAKHLTLTRLGGNRWTAYNWENNASNAGSDYLNQNDDYLGGGNTAGEAVRARVAAARTAGAATIVTVPMAGYVSADKWPPGDVNQTPNYLATRFRVSAPSKNSAFTYPPNVQDKAVYQDEFVAWLEKTFPRSTVNPSTQLFYSLDNEPDLWSSTHSRIHPSPVTYLEMVRRTTQWVLAIKNVSPQALIFGPVSYGFYGYVRLQGATDANDRDFLSYFLSAMRSEEIAHGKRLLDVLDLHWYPEARGAGIRIDGPETSSAVVQARIQAPRSLWDPTYKEDSWIANDWMQGPIHLLPSLRARINQFYPGTKLAFTEYYYGGGNHISGAMAQADVLGIFGRDNVYAATLWSEAPGKDAFTYAGFDVYRNYDGKGGHFGDTAVQATVSSAAASSVYASTDTANPWRMMVVAINKTSSPLASSTTISNFGHYRMVRVFRVSGTTPKVAYVSTVTRTPPTGTAPDTYSAVLPPMSVSVFEFTK